MTTQGMIVPPDPDTIGGKQTVAQITASVDDVVKWLETAVKDVSQGVGEVVGRFFGGIAKGALDAVAGTVQKLVQDLTDQLRALLHDTLEEVKGVIDYAIESLDRLTKRIIDRLVDASRRILFLVKDISDHIAQRSLEVVFETSIQIYELMYELPFRGSPPRLVYVTPYVFRPNFMRVATVHVHGNFLKSYARWWIDDKEVKPISVANRLAVIPIPAQFCAGRVDHPITIKAQHKPGADSLPYCISAKLEYEVQTKVRPICRFARTTTERDAFDYNRPNGLFGNDEVNDTVVFRPRNPNARIQAVRVTAKQLNRGDVTKAYIEGNTARFDVRLDRDGAFPQSDRFVRAHVEWDERQVVVENDREKYRQAFRLLDERSERLEMTSAPYPGFDAIRRQSGFDSATWEASVDLIRALGETEPVAMSIQLPQGAAAYEDTDIKATIDDEGRVYVLVKT